MFNHPSTRSRCELPFGLARYYQSLDVLNTLEVPIAPRTRLESYDVPNHTGIFIRVCSVSRSLLIRVHGGGKRPPVASVNFVPPRDPTLPKSQAPRPKPASHEALRKVAWRAFGGYGS